MRSAAVAILGLALQLPSWAAAGTWNGDVCVGDTSLNACGYYGTVFPPSATAGLACASKTGKCGSCEKGAGQPLCSAYNLNRFVDPIRMCGPGSWGATGREACPMGSVCSGGARKRFGATCSGYSQDDEKRGMFCMKPTLATNVGDSMCFVHPDLQPNVVNAEGTTEKTLPRRSENDPPLVACHPTFSSRLPSKTHNNVYNRWWARRLATAGVPAAPLDPEVDASAWRGLAEMETGCKTCPAGKFADTFGVRAAATDCTDCAAGQTSACPAGKFYFRFKVQELVGMEVAPSVIEVDMSWKPVTAVLHSSGLDEKAWPLAERKRTSIANGETKEYGIMDFGCVPQNAVLENVYTTLHGYGRQSADSAGCDADGNFYFWGGAGATPSHEPIPLSFFVEEPQLHGQRVNTVLFDPSKRFNDLKGMAAAARGQATDADYASNSCVMNLQQFTKMPKQKGFTYYEDPNQLCNCAHVGYKCGACGNKLDDATGKYREIENCHNGMCYFLDADKWARADKGPAAMLAMMSKFTPAEWRELDDAAQTLFLVKAKSDNAAQIQRHMLLKFRGEVGFTTCNECPAGRVQSATGGASCDACPAGQYQGEKGKTACEACPSSEFAPTDGLTKCETCNNWCPAGSAQTDCGTPVDPNDAAKGRSSRGGGCKPCAAGQYKVQGTQECTKCQKGTWGDDNLSVRGGTYCKACPIGRYQDQEAQHATSVDGGCTLCAANTRLDGATECKDTSVESAPVANFDVIDSSNDESLLVGWNVMTFLNRVRQSCNNNTCAVEPMRTFQLWNVTRQKSTSERGFCDAVLTYNVQVQFSVYSPILVKAVKAHGVYTTIDFYSSKLPWGTDTSPSTARDDEVNAFLLENQMGGIANLTNPCLFEDPENNIQWDPSQYLFQAMDSNALQCKRTAAYKDAVKYGMGSASLSFSQPDPETRGFQKPTVPVPGNLSDAGVGPIDVGEDSSFGFGSSGETQQAIAGMGNGAFSPDAVSGDGVLAAQKAETENYQYGSDPSVGGAAKGAVPVGSTATGALAVAAGGKGFGLGAGPSSEDTSPPASCSVGDLQRKLRVFQNDSKYGELRTAPFMLGMNTTINGSMVCQQLALGQPVTADTATCDCSPACLTKCEVQCTHLLSPDCFACEDEDARACSRCFSCKRKSEGHSNTSTAVYGKRTRGLDGTAQVGYATIAGKAHQVQQDSAGLKSCATPAERRRLVGVERASAWGFKARRLQGVAEKPAHQDASYLAKLMNLTTDEFDAFVDTTKKCFDIGGPKAHKAAGNRTARTYLRRMSPVELRDLADGVNGKHVLYEVRPQRVAIEGTMDIAGSKQFAMGESEDFHSCLENCTARPDCHAFTHYAKVAKMGKRAGHCYGTDNQALKDTVTTALVPGTTSGFKTTLTELDGTVLRARLIKRLYVHQQEKIGNAIKDSVTDDQKELRSRWAGSTSGKVDGSGLVETYATPARDLPKSFDPRVEYPQCHTFQHIGAQRAHCNTCWAWSNAQMLSGRLCVQSKGRFTDLISPEAFTNCFAEKCGDTDFQFRALSIQEFREDTKDADLADYFTLLKEGTLKEGIATNLVPYQCVDENWDPKVNPERDGSGPKSELWTGIEDEVGFKYPGCHKGTDWHTMVTAKPLCQRKYPLIRRSSSMLRYPFQYELKTAGSWSGNEMKLFTTELPPDLPVDVSVLGAAYYQELGAAAIKLGAAQDDLDRAVAEEEACEANPSGCGDADALAKVDNDVSKKYGALSTLRTAAFNAKVSGSSAGSKKMERKCADALPLHYTAERNVGLEEVHETPTGATQPWGAESCPKNEHGIHALWKEAGDDGGKTGWHLCSWHYQTAAAQAELKRAYDAVKAYRTCVVKAHYVDHDAASPTNLRPRDQQWKQQTAGDKMIMQDPNDAAKKCVLGPKTTTAGSPTPRHFCTNRQVTAPDDDSMTVDFPPQCMAKSKQAATKGCVPRPHGGDVATCWAKSESNCGTQAECTWMDRCAKHNTNADTCVAEKFSKGATQCQWAIPQPSCASAALRQGAGVCLVPSKTDPADPAESVLEPAACEVDFGVGSWTFDKLSYQIEEYKFPASMGGGLGGSRCLCRLMTENKDWLANKFEGTTLASHSNNYDEKPSKGWFDLGQGGVMDSKLFIGGTAATAFRQESNCIQFNTFKTWRSPLNPKASRRNFDCQWFKTYYVPKSEGGQADASMPSSTETERPSMRELACNSFAARYKGDCEYDAPTKKCKTRYGAALGPLEWIRECKKGVYIPPNFMDKSREAFQTRETVRAQLKIANAAGAGFIADAREATLRCRPGKCVQLSSCAADCGTTPTETTKCVKCPESESDCTTLDTKNGCQNHLNTDTPPVKKSCAWVANFNVAAADDTKKCYSKATAAAGCVGDCVLESKYDTQSASLVDSMVEALETRMVKKESGDTVTAGKLPSNCASKSTDSCFAHMSRHACEAPMRPDSGNGQQMPTCYWSDTRCRPVDQSCTISTQTQENARRCGTYTTDGVWLDVCEQWSEMCVPGKCEAKGVYTNAAKYVTKCAGIATHAKCSAWPTSAQCSWVVDGDKLKAGGQAVSGCRLHDMDDPAKDYVGNATDVQAAQKSKRKSKKKSCHGDEAGSCVWTTALVDEGSVGSPTQALRDMSPCVYNFMSRFPNKCRPRGETCPHVCAPEKNKKGCEAVAAQQCAWTTKKGSPIFNIEDWRVMDWKGMTQAQRSDTCRDFFVMHARRVTGLDDIAGVLGLFGARLEFEQENFDAYECGAENGCVDGVEKHDLPSHLRTLFADNGPNQLFNAAEFNSNMKTAYTKSASLAQTQENKVLGRKQFMEVLLAAQEELMMREILRGGVATGLKSATLQFSAATADMLDCDCFINDDGIFTCDPAPWLPDSAHGQYADHALVLIGWGEDGGVPYWIGKNSWGTSWGDYGYFKIRRGVNSCLVELAHPVTADPDIKSLEVQTTQLSRNLFREHEPDCQRCTFGTDGSMACPGRGSAAVDAAITSRCQTQFKGSTNRWDRWSCKRGGFFNPALIRTQESCFVNVNTKTVTDGVTLVGTEAANVPLTPSNPVDGTNVPLCSTRLNEAECTAFSFTTKHNVVVAKPCVWGKPPEAIPCTCLYPYANEDEAARAKGVFASNTKYDKTIFEVATAENPSLKPVPYHPNLVGCTKCAPRCANGGVPSTGAECKCVCLQGFGGDNCEDHLRVECNSAQSYPVLHYHLSFPATPGDYFTSSPGEGVYTLACERRFPVCKAKKYHRDDAPDGCVCKNADLTAGYDIATGNLLKPGGKDHDGNCDYVGKDCNCVQRDGVLLVDDLSSSGIVTMKYVRFFKGYTHSMADTYHTHGGDTFEVKATACKKPRTVQCLPGSFRRLGDAECHLCPAGRFTNEAMLALRSDAECQVCAAGQFTAEAGNATQCTSCDAGFTTVPQSERMDPPPSSLTRKCKLQPKCTMAIAYVIGIYQNLDKGKNGGCSMYWARAVKYALNAGYCSTGELGYQPNDAKWGASDSADPMSHAWKSDAVRDCWSATSDPGAGSADSAKYKSIATRYKDFQSGTQWGPLCDISPASPRGCALGDRCLDAIGYKFKTAARLAPDYVQPADYVPQHTSSDSPNFVPLFLRQLMSTQKKFATCPQFWEKQLSDVMVQSTGEWELSRTTGMWEFVSYDICPMVAAPVWHSPVYRRCWNAIRHLPFSFNGAAFQTPACDPTNQCHPASDDWVNKNPLAGGSCLDVDGNGATDAFDVLAIRTRMSRGTGESAQKEIAAMYSRRQTVDSTGAMSPAEVLTAVDMCNGQAGVSYHVSSATDGAFTDLDAKLLMAYVSTQAMGQAVRLQTIEALCSNGQCVAQTAITAIEALNILKMSATQVL